MTAFIPPLPKVERDPFLEIARRLVAENAARIAANPELTRMSASMDRGTIHASDTPSWDRPWASNREDLA